MMDLVTYGIVLLLLFILELVYFRIADKYDIIDRPNERSSHKTVTLRGGGIVFLFGAVAFFLLSGFSYPWFILGLILISFVSFIDDIHSLPDKYRLVVQFASMALLFYDANLFSYPWWLLPIALVVCVGIINAYNFMDGINGITGGYSLVVLCGLLYVNEKICGFVDSRLIIFMISACLVFCFFNFRKNAKCFAGDVGSVSIAFVIVFLLGKLMLKTQELGWICFLAVYGVDTVLTIIHRIMLHENLGKAHRKHMFQIMANELKIPHLTVSAIYMVVQALIIALFLLVPSLWTAVVCFGVLSIIYVLFMMRFFKLHLANSKE